MAPNRKISFIEDVASTASLQLVQEPIKLLAQLLPLQEKGDHEQLQDPTCVVGTTTTSAAADYYWDWAAFKNRNDQDTVQGANESNGFECFFSIQYIEAKLIQEAAERLQASKETIQEVVVAVIVDDDSSPDSSYWDMPTDEQALVSMLLGNNQPQKNLSCGHHHRPQHHAAPTGMDMNAYWNDNVVNKQEDDYAYWNDPSHSHYRGANATIHNDYTRLVTTFHHAVAPVDLETMSSYWDEATPASANTTMMNDIYAADDYWIDPAASHDKLGYWDWPIVWSFCFDEEEVMQELQPGCSVNQNDAYWLF